MAVARSEKQNPRAWSPNMLNFSAISAAFLGALCVLRFVARSLQNHDPRGLGSGGKNGGIGGGISGAGGTGGAGGAGCSKASSPG